jgi:hypothetical protein
MCANCRRFVRHMKITRELSKQMVLNKTADDVDTIWNKVQQQIKQDSQSD